MKEETKVLNSSSKSKAFKFGTDDLDVTKTRKALFHNKDAYKKTHSWGSKFNLEFDDALSFIIDGMENGTITDVDTSGKFNYSGNGSDYIDGSNAEKTKAVRAAAAYASEVMRLGVETSKLTAAAKAKYSADLSDDFKKKYNAGKDWDETAINAFIDLDPIAEGEETRSTKNRAAKYKALIDEKIQKIKNGEYDMGDYSQEEELLKLIVASLALADGVVSDNEYSILAAAGASPSDTKVIFGKGNVTATSNALNEKWKKRKEELKATGNYTDALIDSLIELEKKAANNSAEAEIAKTTLTNSDYEHNLEWNKYKALQYLGTFNKSWNLGDSSFKDTASYENAIAKLNLDVDAKLKEWLYNPDGFTNGIANTKYLKNALDYVYKKAPDLYFADAGNNEYLVKSSIDYNTGRALVYNPTAKTLREISPANNKILQQALAAKWFENHPYSSTNGTSSWKHGGTLKLQSGGTIEEQLTAAVLSGLMTADQANAYYQQYLQLLAAASTASSGVLASAWDSTGSERFNLPDPIGSTTSNFNILDNALTSVVSRAKAKNASALNALKLRAAANGRTIELEKEGERKIVDSKGKLQLTAREWWDIGNMAADVASMISAWVPGYGTAVSAALGYGSSISKLGHDLTDKSMSTWDALKGLGVNLALDSVGLIPGLGTSSKTGKIVKTATKLVPTLLAAYGTYTEFKPALAALEKLTSKDGKDLTLDEWKHIGNFLTAISGTNRVAASHIKTKIMANTAKGETSNSFSIKTKGGLEIKIEDDEVKNIIKNNMNDPTTALEKLRALATGDNATKYKDFKDIELATSKKWLVFGKDKISGVSDKTINPNSNWFAPYDVSNPTAALVKQYATPTNNWFNRAANWAGLRSDYELASLGGWNPFLAVRLGETSINPFRYLAGYGLGQGWGINVSNPWAIEKEPSVVTTTTPATTPTKVITTLTTGIPLTNVAAYKPATSNLASLLLSNPLSTSIRTQGLAPVGTLKPTILADTPIGFGFKLGGKIKALNYIKSLRGNFKSELPTHKKGGILKAQTGGSVYQTPLGDAVVENPEDWAWYRNLYNQLVLISPELRSHNLYANASNLYEHNLNFDLGRAAKKNDAYIHTPLIVSDDLQNYYNTAYGNSTIDDFITNYNKDAAKIRSTWEGDTKHKANTEKGLKAHNLLFKKMFSKRSQTNNQDMYNIGYLEDLDDIMGTSTWMRRMDRYKNEWENTDDEDKASRIHAIKLGDGTTAYVYKKANGDIAKLTEEAYNKLKNITPKESTTNTTKGLITPEEYLSTLDYLNKIGGYAKDALSKIDPADVIALGRYLKNNASNKKVAQMERDGLSVVYKSPLNEHLLVIRGLDAEAEATRLKNQMVAAVLKAKTSDASTNIAALMDAVNRGALLEMQALQAADTDVKQQIKEADAIDKKVYEHNLEVKDTNATADANYKKAIADINASELAASMLNLNTFLMEYESRIRQKRADELAFNDQLAQYLMQNSISDDAQYKALYLQYLDETDATKKKEILKKAEERLKQISEDAYYEYYKLFRRNHNFNDSASYELLNGLNKNKGFVADFDKKGGILRKKGGTLLSDRIKARTEDIKELNKIVQNGIKNHLKSLDNLSRSTLLAIKKALNQ